MTDQELNDIEAKYSVVRSATQPKMRVKAELLAIIPQLIQGARAVSQLNTKLVDCLLDVVNQSCQVEYTADGRCIVDHSCTSAYEDAIWLLERLGCAKKISDRTYELRWPNDNQT